jgi:hypothetical protein
MDFCCEQFKSYVKEGYIHKKTLCLSKDGEVILSNSEFFNIRVHAIMEGEDGPPGFKTMHMPLNHCPFCGTKLLEN